MPSCCTSENKWNSSATTYHRRCSVSNFIVTYQTQCWQFQNMTKDGKLTQTMLRQGRILWAEWLSKPGWLLHLRNVMLEWSKWFSCNFPGNSPWITWLFPFYPFPLPKGNNPGMFTKKLPAKSCRTQICLFTVLLEVPRDHLALLTYVGFYWDMLARYLHFNSCPAVCHITHHVSHARWSSSPW